MVKKIKKHYKNPSSKIASKASISAKNSDTSSKEQKISFWKNLLTRTMSAIIFIPLLVVFIIFLGFKVTIITAGVLLTSEIIRVMRNLNSHQRCTALFYLGFLYYVLFLFFIIGTTKQGGYKILTFLILIACSDIGAYLFGSLCQGPKLCKKISPSKTVSGSIAGIIFPIVAYYALMLYVSFIPVVEIVFYKLIIICVLAEIGDLTQSALKRYFKIKDFANILPGHGGLLDRFDSSTLAIIYFYYFV